MDKQQIMELILFLGVAGAIIGKLDRIESTIKRVEANGLRMLGGMVRERKDD